MNKDEMIKDLINVLKNQCDNAPFDYCVGCDCNECKARTLINAGYRKVGEDEIVIKESEYEALLLEQKRLKEIVDRIPCGYKLIGNEEVVISKHLYEQLKKHNADRKRLRLRWQQTKQEVKDTEKKTKQETAREILQEMFDYCKEDVYGQVTVDFNCLETLARKYGIELED